MRLHHLAAAAFLVVAAVGNEAHAGYTGQTITGTLAFGPNGASGGQHWDQNTIVAPGTFSLAQPGGNIDSATFGDSTLTITDQVISNANGWKMTFADDAMPFSSLTLVSSNFAPDITFSDTAGVIEVDWVGTGTPGTDTAVFDISGTPVPEPGTLAIFGLGLFGLGLLRQRRAFMPTAL